MKFLVKYQFTRKLNNYEWTGTEADIINVSRETFADNVLQAERNAREAMRDRFFIASILRTTANKSGYIIRLKEVKEL